MLLLWRNHEHLMLHEVSQSQKDKYYRTAINMRNLEQPSSQMECRMVVGRLGEKEMAQVGI